MKVGNSINKITMRIQVKQLVLCSRIDRLKVFLLNETREHQVSANINVIADAVQKRKTDLMGRKHASTIGKIILM